MCNTTQLLSSFVFHSVASIVFVQNIYSFHDRMTFFIILKEVSIYVNCRQFSVLAKAS